MPEGNIGIVEREKREKAERLRRAREERERRRREARQREAERARQRARRPDAEKSDASPRTFRDKPDSYISPTEQRAVAREQSANEERARRRAQTIARKRSPRDDDRKPRRETLEVAGFEMPSTLLSKVAKDIEDVATNTPGGIWALSKAVGGDVKENPALAAGVLPGVALAKARGKSVAPRSTGIAKAIGKQYVDAYSDPLDYAQEHPGMLLLDALAVASAGAGAGSRVSAAGSAAKAARAAGTSPVRAALTRATSEGGSLLRRAPAGKRVHYYEGRKLSGRYSQNPLSRAVQKQHDREALSRAKVQMERTGEPVSTISTRKASRLLAEERRIIDARERVPALKVLADSKKMSTGEQLAVQVVAEGLPLDDVIKSHLQMAATLKGKARKRHTRRAQLLESARPYLTVNKAGKPVFAKGHTDLAKKMRNAERAVAKREKGLSKEGVLSDEQIEYRTHAPGRVLLGAKWEPLPLSQSAGKQAFQLVGKRVRTRDGVRGVITDLDGDTATVRPWSKKAGGPFEASLEDLFPAAKTKKGRLVGGNRAVQYERPRTLEEAQKVADDLQAKLDKAEGAIAKRLMENNPDKYPSRGYAIHPSGPKKETRRVHEADKGSFRHYRRRRQDPAQGDVIESSGGAAYAKPGKTGKELALEDARKMLSSRAAADDAHPLYRAYAQAQRELEEIKTALLIESEKGTPFEGLTTAPEGVTPSLGSVTEARVLDEFRGGRFRVPEATQDKPWLMKRSPQYQGGVPRKPGTVTQHYTGGLRRSGKTTIEPVRAIAEDALQAERYLSLERLRKRIVPMGRQHRPADTRTRKWVPVRARNLTKDEAKQLRELLREPELEKLTPDEAAAIEARVQAVAQTMFPEDLGSVPVGTKVDGVVWVDKRLISSQRKIIPGGRVPVFDDVADAVKGIFLYLKPGYMSPNLIGNAALNVFQQGFLAPANWTRAARLSDDLKHFVDEAMGQGFASSLAAGTRSPISEGVQKAGSAWGIFVDKPFRRASFLHEARKMGYRSNKELRSLFEGRGKKGDFHEITQRARDAIVDYERLSPVEQDIIRRAIFVYPWMRGSAHYAAQFVRDHPIQAAVYARIGQEQAERTAQEVGPLPSWREGAFKVGGSKEEPWLVDPRFVNPFETVGMAAAMGAGAAGLKNEGRTEKPGQALHPLLKAAIETGFGRDLFTGREIDTTLSTPFARLGRQSPQYQLADRYFKRGESDEKANPVKSLYDVAAPFVVGSVAPRRTNAPVLNKQARDEGRETVSGPERVRSDNRLEQKVVLSQLGPQLKANPTLGKRLREAYSRKIAVEVARREAEDLYPVGDDREREKLRREIGLLRKWGLVSPTKAREIAKIAEKGQIAEVKSWRGILVSEGFENAYLELRREAMDAAGVSP